MEGDSFIGQLQELLSELSLFKGDDILVHLNEKQCLKMESGKHELTKELEKIINDAKKIDKEKGIFPLCKSSGVVSFTHQNKDVETPIFIIPLTVQVNRINKTATFTEIIEEAIINPFLAHKLEKEFPHIKSSNGFEVSETFIELLRGLGFERIDTETATIGNFHHHRLALIGELEQIIEQKEWSNPLLEIFGEEINKDNVSLNLPVETLFPFDQKQLEVFEQLKVGNCVVQGPPGTGKSQVICNVIGKLVSAQNTAVVVSDKRVALEVIQQKLDTIGLGNLSVITTTHYSSSAFINSLKKNWVALENTISTNENHQFLVHDEIELLQQELKILNQPGLVGGLRASEFIALTKSRSFNTSEYRSNFPSITSWLENKALLKKLPLELMQLLRYLKDINQQIETIHQFDTVLKTWLKDAEQLQMQFKIDNFGDFKLLFDKARICHRFSTDYFKKFEQVILTKSKEFLDYKKKYTKALLLLEKTAVNQNHWIKIPTPIELAYLENKYQLKGILNRYSWKYELKKWLRTPEINFSDAVKTLKKAQELESEVMQIQLKFSEMGIENLKIDLDMIASLIEVQDQNDWALFSKISLDDRAELTTNYSTINNLVTQFKTQFNFTNESDCVAYLKELLSRLDFIIPFSSILLTIPKDLIDCYQQTLDLDQLENQLFHSAWTTFRSNHPVFSLHDSGNLLARINKINAQFDAEASLLSKTINQKQQQKFQAFHLLLQTPAHKLTTEQKEKKRQLKLGKSILVKEFAKKRSHKSIRELLSSDASEWIQLLKPIWLTNPSQLASNIPLQKNYFDLSIIDEASQLLLSHSIGCLYRSKRMLIAGDTQQMAPSNYFNSKDENSLTLLHKASFYFKNVYLHYHFRSEHPSLIAYSNEHFYNNELIAFPTVNQAQLPIKFHYIEKGLYNNRTNENEASKVAKFIASLLPNTKEKIGIVAFSESQLACIFEKLSASAQLQLMSRIDDDTIFFKALEQIQGDECDRLIISFGYAKNEEGKFEMRFGPVNEKNGAKRLNVLFSRARKNIDFFASVSAKDFSLSSNTSVRLLWKWFQFIESEQINNSHIQFPFKLALTQHKNKLSCDNWENLSDYASDILTITRTLKSRGWDLTAN